MNRFFCIVLVLGCAMKAMALSHHPQAFLSSIAGTAHEGEQIVAHYCAMCHAEKSPIRLGAPRIGRVEDWKPRMKQGLSHLFKRADEGVNAMPARGGCFECTDEQLMLAIMTLLPEVFRKDNK